MIVKDQEFAGIIRDSEMLAKNSIITFGIRPSGPNTGYGYIAPGEQKLNGYQVIDFEEKPKYDAAVSYVAAGYYWNAGIFMFDTEIFISEVKLHAANIYSAFETSSNINEAFAKIDDKISIDYGIMEKSSIAAVVPVDIEWNDMGCFDSVYDVFDKDVNNNIVHSDNIVIDSKNNYIYAKKGKIISIVGVDDLILVDNGDALLICKKDHSQKVQEIVKTRIARTASRVEY